MATATAKSVKSLERRVRDAKRALAKAKAAQQRGKGRATARRGPVPTAKTALAAVKKRKPRARVR